MTGGRYIPSGGEMGDLPACPRCGGGLVAEAGPFRGVIGRCASCGVRFEVALKPLDDPFAVPASTDAPPAGDPTPLNTPDALRGPSPFGASDPMDDARKLASAMDLPRGFRLDTSGDKLHITWRWWNASHLFIMLFAAFWDTFMVVWYAIALTTGQWAMAAFGVIHASVGVGLAYYALTGLLNHTRITLTPSRVAVAHGPLPWPGSRTLDRADVEQLYVSRVETQNKGSVSVTYHLNVMLRDGAELPIVKGLDSAEQARFLESRIEAALGIQNHPVHGEYR